MATSNPSIKALTKSTKQKEQQQKTQQTIAKEIQLLDNIASKSTEILSNAEDALYGRLRETYVLYYKWMNSKSKHLYFDELESYLVKKKIPFQANTSEALMMTKAILGAENKAKASKYGKHMDTAFRKGITAKEYPAWMQENGVEVVSRKKPRIKHGKKVKIDERSLLERASQLIYKWLEIKEAIPIASSSIVKGSVKSYATLKDSTTTNTQYELAICKRRKDKNNTEVIDTLWILPKTVAIEEIFMHQLAHAIYNDLPNLEAQMAEEELKVLGSEIDQLMLEDEIYQFAYQDDQLILNKKLSDAHVEGRDIGSVYSTHKFVKPKIKRINSKSK